MSHRQQLFMRKRNVNASFCFRSTATENFFNLCTRIEKGDKKKMYKKKGRKKQETKRDWKATEKKIVQMLMLLLLMLLMMMMIIIIALSLTKNHIVIYSYRFNYRCFLVRCVH